jgi:hypothetical protein
LPELHVRPNPPGLPRGLLFGLGAPDDFDGRYNTQGRHNRLR